MAEKKMIFTPSGGMNQDDSLITPSKDAAGRSLFELGDYRYASNLRIGSSRSEHFGDAENIKSTVEVEAANFYTTEQIFENPMFIGSLSPWLQLDDGPGYTAWVYNAGTRANFSTQVAGNYVSRVLYQNISGLVAGSATVQTHIYQAFGIAQFPPYTISVVYLNGTSVISEEDIFMDEFVFSPPGKTLNLPVTIPANCTGIGFRVRGLNTDSVFGVGFSIENFRIFTLIQQSAPSGTEKVVGRLEDKEFLKYYYAVYNSEGDHSIRVYDLATGTINILLLWSGLNFTESSFVKMAKLDNWLALTDRINPPRLIDVDNIGSLFSTLGEDNFREFHISFHKWAPCPPPVPRIYYDGATNNFSKLKNKNIQFAYRYIYNGNLKSRFSPISKGCYTGITGSFYPANTISSIEVYVQGSLLDEPGANTQYNFFGHDDIKFYSAVDTIELVFRESELDIWRLWKRVKYPFTTSYLFDGKYDGRPISLDDFDQQFDTVPFLAGTVEAIDNRFVFGDCLDEQEPAVFTAENVSTVTDPTLDWRESNPAVGFPQFAPGIRDNLLRYNALSNFNLKARGVYKVGIQFMAENGWRSATYTDDALTVELPESSAYRLNAICFKIPAQIVPPEWATSYQILRTNVINIDYFMIGMANKFIPLLDSANALIGLSSLPQNVKDKLNADFQNTNLVNGYEVASAIDREKEILDKKLLRNALFKIKEKSDKNFINLSGTSKSLSDAIKKAPRISSFLSEIRSSAQSTLANSARIFIDLNNWFNATKTSTTADRQLNKLYYNFRQGDRVRFYGSELANPTISSQLKIYDVEIIEYTGTGLIVEKPAGCLSIPTEVSPYNVGGFSIEIYTPKIAGASDYLFYETGEWYPILYPGTSSRDFSKRDWVYTSNSAVTVATYGPYDVFSKMPLFLGDCYRITRTVYRDFSPLASGIGTSMNPDPSASYAYWDKNNGRPSISYEDLPVSRFKTTQLRFGGKIVEESSINAINRFRDEDQFIYPSEYGRVRALVNTSNAQVESVGSILFAIGERESWSIYVNRTTLEDLSGNTQVAMSDKVLGSYNTMLGGHGTLNPESVSSDRGRVWWWDGIDGVWCRYSRDGVTEISSYKMRNWFKEIADLLAGKYATSELPRVVCDYDPFNDELVTYISHSALPATFRGYTDYKGVFFSEEDTRWKSVHTYTPEFFGKIGTLLISFKAGKLYKHEQGTDYNSFYDVKQDSYIEPVFNEESLRMKSWQDLAIVATNKWSVERILSEYRGIKTKQESRLLLASFTEKEDGYYSAIKNNLNTPNVDDPIVNGEKMRSKAIQVLMKLDPAVVTLSLLHYVVAGTIDSPKNPV